MEGDASLPKFRVDTEVVPPGVDLELASQRNRLIEAFRSGDEQAEATLRKLLSLYWTTQRSSDDATRFYLMDATGDFSLEANVDPDVDSALWVEAQERYA